MNLRGNSKRMFGLAVLATGVLVAGASAVAQDSPQGSGQPARAVRLSYVDGQVKLSQGDQVLADNAVVNTPLFEGTQLTTGDDGKAEIQFEDGSVARLAPDSSLTLSVLSGAGASADAELNLNVGLAYFEFQGGNQAGQFSVHFGSSVATTSGFTALRVNMDNPPGSLAVFSGNVHLDIGSNFGAGVSADLHGGENIALNPADPSNYSLAESIDPNSWDAWNSDRDEELTTEAAAQTDAPENLGATQNPAWSDLDANGTWYNVPDQGYVWSPYDAQNGDFDPYGNGNWVYTVSYGYVWASAYPWGYMPYHCGTWNFYPGFGWAWSPGGGCNPWWNAGFYGGANIGIVPVGYRPLPRPLPPHWPIGHRPIPLIAVHRHFDTAPARFPARDRNTQVTISGTLVNAVQPHPVTARQSFMQPGNHPMPMPVRGGEHVQFYNRPPNYGAGQPPGGPATRQGYVPPPMHPGVIPPPPQANRPATPPPPQQNRWYTPPPNPSNNGSQNHPSGNNNAPRWNGGGNNGGGSHPSGGGNTGGGGGHPSGGGNAGGGGHPSGGGGGGHH